MTSKQPNEYNDTIFANGAAESNFESPRDMKFAQNNYQHSDLDPSYIYDQGHRDTRNTKDFFGNSAFKSPPNQKGSQGQSDKFHPYEDSDYDQNRLNVALSFPDDRFHTPTSSSYKYNMVNHMRKGYPGAAAVANMEGRDMNSLNNRYNYSSLNQIHPNNPYPQIQDQYLMSGPQQQQFPETNYNPQTNPHIFNPEQSMFLTQKQSEISNGEPSLLTKKKQHLVPKIDQTQARQIVSRDEEEPPKESLRKTSNSAGQNSSHTSSSSGRSDVQHHIRPINISQESGQNIVNAGNQEAQTDIQSSVEQGSGGIQPQILFSDLPHELGTTVGVMGNVTAPIGSGNSGSPVKQTRTCNCKKTQCLKLYCDCFAVGELCSSDCSCYGCRNIPHDNLRYEAIQVILDKQPQAFTSKIQGDKKGKKLIHKKGCNCRRSGCLKKYCQCFAAKIQCSDHCKCDGCENCDKPRKQVFSNNAGMAYPVNSGPIGSQMHPHPQQSHHHQMYHHSMQHHHNPEIYLSPGARGQPDYHHYQHHSEQNNGAAVGANYPGTIGYQDPDFHSVTPSNMHQNFTNSPGGYYPESNPGYLHHNQMPAPSGQQGTQVYDQRAYNQFANEYAHSGNGNMVNGGPGFYNPRGNYQSNSPYFQNSPTSQQHQIHLQNSIHAPLDARESFSTPNHQDPINSINNPNRLNDGQLQTNNNHLLFSSPISNISKSPQNAYYNCHTPNQYLNIQGLEKSGEKQPQQPQIMHPKQQLAQPEANANPNNKVLNQNIFKQNTQIEKLFGTSSSVDVSNHDGSTPHRLDSKLKYTIEDYTNTVNKREFQKASEINEDMNSIENLKNRICPTLLNEKECQNGSTCPFSHIKKEYNESNQVGASQSQQMNYSDQEQNATAQKTGFVQRMSFEGNIGANNVNNNQTNNPQSNNNNNNTNLSHFNIPLSMANSGSSVSNNTNNNNNNLMMSPAVKQINSTDDPQKLISTQIITNNLILVSNSNQ